MEKAFVKEICSYQNNELVAKFINGDEKQYLVKYENKLQPVSKFYYVNYLLNRKKRVPSQVKVSLWFKFQRFYYSL
jgi:hypothetical protein